MAKLKLKPEALRVQLGLTQKEMAQKLGISEVTYIKRVKHQKQWKSNEIVVLSELTGIPIQNIDIS